MFNDRWGIVFALGSDDVADLDRRELPGRGRLHPVVDGSACERERFGSHPLKANERSASVVGAPAPISRWQKRVKVSGGGLQLVRWELPILDPPPGS